MSEQYRVGIIGCGRIADMHARGYNAEPRTTVVALSEIEEGKAEEFAEEHGFDARIYADYREMLAGEDLDLVSICLWTVMHPEAVAECVEAGVPCIHCEKPMAPTWGEALQIAEAVEGTETQLTFNHQRRFVRGFRRAKELLDGGDFGPLRMIEAYIPANLLDWGTHLLDLCAMYNDESPAAWVIGQIDAREPGKWFGVPYEFMAAGLVRYQNGVRAMLHCGDDKELRVGVRLHAADGTVEITGDGFPLRARQFGGPDRDFPEIEEESHETGGISRVIGHILDCHEAGREPELSVNGALRATETIFSLYESSRSRARINLPLESRDSAFISMLEEGVIGPSD